MRRYLKLFFITAMISPIVACGGSTEEKNIDDKTLVIWHSISDYFISEEVDDFKTLRIGLIKDF